MLLLSACDLCAADAGVLPGSDLGVAQQVSQVQRKLHEVQDKLEAAETRSETLGKHAEVVEAELKATKESAEAELTLLKESQTAEVESASGRLNDALSKIQMLEEEVATLSSLKTQLESERSNLLKLAANGKKAENVEKRAKLLEEEKQRQLERAEKAERGEAAQRELVLQLKVEGDNLREQAAEAAAKVAKLEAALLQAQAELSAKDQVMSNWLPPWAAAKINPVQEAFLVRWFKHGHPVYQQVSSMLTSRASTAHEWAQPHIKRARTAAGHSWQVVGEPTLGYVQATHQRLMPVVAAEWAEHATPVLGKIHEGAASAYTRVATLAGPHAQKARQGLAATIDKLLRNPQYRALSAAAAPYVHQFQKLLRPVLDAARLAMGSAKDLHDQAVQFALKQLSSNSATAAYATTKNAHVVVYIILALPAVLIFASYPTLRKEAHPKLPGSTAETFAKKKRRMVPGKPGQDSAMGKRSSGIPTNFES
ncbi:hypothetical protein KFL_006330040 [Klebsormidium nitens]|uniref:Uncharacterized protein n=1 Tax=Klebsormidium nitens TaxID=105231 RepID=A0A1Y1IP33_KLENI|nr:hypothetical protein KFL_006330040 [Klebsormidium nitens]|eukprot:GAQ90377.1 hypothetical protein KFL_006330040 [Klebsormidium nitens]